MNKDIYNIIVSVLGVIVATIFGIVSKKMMDTNMHKLREHEAAKKSHATQRD